MKFVLVVNPVAGKGKALKVAGQLRQCLEGKGYQTETLFTTPNPGVFRKTCQRIASEDRVVCLGGDGTLLQFINARPRFESVAFYGVGTANVLSIEFKIPSDLRAFVEMIEANRHIHYRTGQAQDGTRFLMMYSFGFDGFLLNHLSQPLKNRMGKAAFLPAAWQALWRYTYPPVQVQLDGQTQIKGSLVIVSRIKHYGGPYCLAPAADPSGDVFQVTLLKPTGFWALLRFFLGVACGRLASSGSVFLGTAKTVELFTPNDMPCHQMDGDPMNQKVRQLHVDSTGFRFIIP